MPTESVALRYTLRGEELTAESAGTAEETKNSHHEGHDGNTKEQSGEEFLPQRGQVCSYYTESEGTKFLSVSANNCTPSRK